MLINIIAFLSALPRILALMEELGKLIIEHNLNGYMTELENNIDVLKKAKTSDEKLKAASLMADSIRHLK